MHDDRKGFTPREVANLHRHQFGQPVDEAGVPYGEPFRRTHPFTCPDRGDGNHFDNGGDVGMLVPTVRGWICQCCDHTQDWAHPSMLEGRSP